MYQFLQSTMLHLQALTPSNNHNVSVSTTLKLLQAMRPNDNVSVSKPLLALRSHDVSVAITLQKHKPQVPMIMY